MEHCRLPGRFEHAPPHVTANVDLPTPASGERIRNVREVLMPAPDEHVRSTCHASMNGMLTEFEEERRAWAGGFEGWWRLIVDRLRRELVDPVREERALV